MVYAVIKEGEQVEVLVEEDFSADKDEKYLHKLIEENTYIISRYITKKEVVTLGSRVKLPSGGELDLLLIDSEGNIILVELKRDKGTREAIAQLLDYASELQTMNPEDLFRCSGIKFRSINDVYELFKGMDFDKEVPYKEFEENVRSCLSNPESLQLLLVSYRVGEDALRLVNWLRNFRVNIRCIEFSYFRKGKREVFVPKLVGVGVRDLTQESYLKFFTEILSEFKVRKPGVNGKISPSGYWLAIPTGDSGFYFEWDIYGRQPKKLRFGLYIYFESHNKEENNKVWITLLQKKDEIEQKIGEELIHKTGKKWSGIYVEREIKSLDVLADEGLKKWAVDTMIKFYDTLKPVLDEAVRETR